MEASSIPTKIVLPFANNAGGSYINVVPVPSQIGITNGAASFYDGFPPNTFVALAAGGAGPFGKDFNGLLNVMSAWERWYCAGGPIAYDSTFQAVSQVGGYPHGALVASATVLGTFWLSTVDNNVTNPDTGGAGWVNFLALGGIGTGGKLVYSSTIQITLNPVNGGMLWINGINQPIQAGLTLSNAGLSASTNYFVYAYMNSGTMTLEASTTGYTKNANGIPQKSGDATRTLVGGFGTTSGSLFQAGVVGSYFNRTSTGITKSQASVGFNNTGVLAKISALFDIAFWAWADEAVESIAFRGLAQNDTAGTTTTLQTFVDGSSFGVLQEIPQFAAGGIAGNFYSDDATPGNYTDGAHLATLFGNVSSGNGLINQGYGKVTVRL